MRILLPIVVWLLGASAAVAQSVPGAEAALLKYAEATKSYNTSVMASLMHPEALARFRSAIDGALKGPKGDAAKADLLPIFAVSTVDDYFKLSDVEAYKRLNDTIASASPKLIGLMASAKYEIVGSLLKDDVAHVTYNLKMNIDGQVVNTPVVQSLKQHNDTWLLMLPPTSEAAVAGIQAQFR